MPELLLLTYEPMEEETPPPAYVGTAPFQEGHAGPPATDEHGKTLRYRDPSPQQIKAMCEEIQATWSAREEKYRAMSPHLDDPRSIRRALNWRPPMATVLMD